MQQHNHHNNMHVRDKELCVCICLAVCEDCEEVYDGDCPIHGPLRCLDPSAGWDEDSKAYTTVPVPAQLTVKTSDIIDAGK